MVVSVCSMQTSQVGTFNVIPDAVRLVGTVRSVSRRDARAGGAAHRRDRRRAWRPALGGSAEVDYRRGYPATVNSEREADFAARVGEHVFGERQRHPRRRATIGSEDFSYMLQARPGAYVWLGHGGAPAGCHLHNPNYDFNDEMIPLGAGYLAALAEAALPLAHALTKEAATAS